jgi:sugar phosphate isomerase/epimerase
MNNFLIGMYGKFDRDKYNRDMRKGFYGVEATMFESMNEVNEMVSTVKNDGYNLTVHYPLIKGSFWCIHPLFIDRDKKIREESYEAFEREIELAVKIGARHILTHFPKPAVIDRELDWSSWRFTTEKEYGYSDEYDEKTFRELSTEMFDRLSELSKIYNIKVVLEHDILNNYTYNTDLLESLFNEYNNLRFCIDTGRVHLFSKTDRGFNPYKFIEAMSQYTHMVHLWNVKVDNNISGGHYPVLPELKTKEGWADIEGYVKGIFKNNKECLVMFEHRSDMISDSQLEKCYSWVESLINNAK